MSDKAPVGRLPKNELQAMNIVILRGVNEKDPSLCVMGWTEDKPHDSDEAAVLQEPLYFYPVRDTAVTPGSAPVEIVFIAPPYGVPMCAEFFTYSQLDIYEGVGATGVCYIEAVSNARKYVPTFVSKWTKPDHKPPQIPSQQQPPPGMNARPM